MHRDFWPICAILLLSLPTNAESPSHPSDVRMLRIEGAAVDIRRSAEAVEETAKLINNSNSLSHLPRLESQLQTLHSLVISARMAVDVSHEELAPKSIR